LGTAGGPRQAQPILGADTFFLINGDTLTDLLLSDIRSAHGSSGALVTLALVRNTEPLRYGGVLLGGDGVVRGFVPRGASEPSYHFIGVQVVEAEAFATVVPGSAAPSIGGVFDRLIEGRPGSIRGHVCDARFWDIGTIPDYWRTSLAFSDPSDRWPRGSRVSVHPTSAVRRSIVWDDVEVGERSVLDECILTDGVRVPPGSVYRQSILMRTEDGRTIGKPFAVD
jgi:NDP-sugar pyrophosphorylase family protein